MSKQEILDAGVIALEKYDLGGELPADVNQPYTIFHDGFLTIEDRRPDLTASTARMELGYKYKALIDSKPIYFLYWGQFESIVDAIKTYESL